MRVAWKWNRGRQQQGGGYCEEAGQSVDDAGDVYRATGHGACLGLPCLPAAAAAAAAGAFPSPRRRVSLTSRRLHIDANPRGVQTVKIARSAVTVRPPQFHR